MEKKTNETNCCCPRCGSTWHGMTTFDLFFQMFKDDNKKRHLGKTNTQLVKEVKKELERNGKTGKERITRLKPLWGNCVCPDCGLVITEDDIWRIVDNQSNALKSWLIGLMVRLKPHFRFKLSIFILKRAKRLQDKPKALLKGLRMDLFFRLYYAMHPDEFNCNKQ